ncbi:GrpB family protein [Pseudarthrobacter sp. DSP2-3-2b1]|uniref:GrpB family protein n=1 Tax=Pseudarthrobacter sp. DSP2-3-2b1 TaxID=2804661 RepID=UPI003CF3E4EF
MTHPLWRPFEPDNNARRQAGRVAHRQVQPGPLEEHNPSWVRQFASMHDLVSRTIPDQALCIRHVGSTAVPGLLAKPVIDIDLTVPDPTAEPSYVPRLESAGFRLIFRDDVAGDAHRHLTFSEPNTSLHVWAQHATEPRRHELFAAWLRLHEQDRRIYAEAKRAAADVRDSRRYNDRKAAVVYDIYERIFLTDPSHHHSPQPRTRPDNDDLDEQ